MGFYSRLSSFDGASSVSVVGDIAFDTDFARTNWLARGPQPGVFWTSPQSGKLWGGISYSPPAQATIDKAEDNYRRLQGIIRLATSDMFRAQARVADLKTQLLPWVMKANAAIAQWATAESDSSNQPDLVMAYNMITMLVRGFAAESWPDPEAVSDRSVSRSSYLTKLLVLPSSAPPPPPPVFKPREVQFSPPPPPPTSYEPPELHVDRLPVSNAPVDDSGVPLASEGVPWSLIGLGAAALLLVGIFLKRGSSRVAGYSRRKRSRR